MLAFYTAGGEIDHVFFAQQAIRTLTANSAAQGYRFVATTDWDTLTDDTLNASWESGPLASLRLMRACHSQLRDGGVVVNVSSSSSVNPRPVGKLLYAMVKATINSLTRVAAMEWPS